METKPWNKVLLSVFKKSRFLNTVVVEREKITKGYNLLESVENWDTVVKVKDVRDNALVTDKFVLAPGDQETIEEYQTGEYSFLSGYSKMHFRLNNFTAPFLVVSIITTWYDTNYYKGFWIAPWQLEMGADISAQLEESVRKEFPDIKARTTEDNKIAVEFEGQTIVLDPTKRDQYITPTRETDSSTVRIEGEDIDMDYRVRIQIESIC